MRNTRAGATKNGPRPKHKDKNPKIVQGQIFITSKATGYVSSEKFSEDIEIRPDDLNTALHNDEVAVKLTGKFPSGRMRGVVDTIIHRAKDRFVGTVDVRNGTYILIPDNKKFYTHIELPEKHRGAVSPGDKALVQIIRWNDPRLAPIGTTLQIIGKKGDNTVEMRSIALEKGFDSGYPDAVLAEANSLSINAREIISKETSRRRDFRDTLTLTIDPKDAKDFDDAISYKQTGPERYEIGIHIADVSHYVRPRTAIDREARERQFSVYLADRTIPMLPPTISDDLCSLNPHEEKLAFSTVFEMDTQGHIHSRWFGKSIIRSAHRFSYEDAQASISDPNGIYHKELNVLNAITRKLNRERGLRGAISFEKDEVKVEVDASGRPTRIYKKSRLDAHKLVEEFMLLANREVAEFIFKGHEKHGVARALVYRIHDAPDREKIKELGIFLGALGYELPIPKNGRIRAKDINAILKQVQGKAEESLVTTAAIRSMAKAIYSTRNIGHFGLAFEYYSHFTSPIRRYPDLLVHRILEHHLNGTRASTDEVQEYELLCSKATDREIAAAEAERESIKLKQVEYMQQYLKTEFAGVISGVTEWGIYIEELETGSEGMVRLKDIPGDSFTLDEKNYRIVGERTKKMLSLGDRVRFIFTGADIERRALDAQLIN